MTGDQVDGALVVCMILTAFLVIGAISGLLALAVQHLEGWLDQQLAERRRLARQNLADPILAAHRGRRVTAGFSPRRLEGPRR